MKFRSVEDYYSFCTDINRPDLVKKSKDEISEEVLREFFQTRRPLVNKYKNYIIDHDTDLWDSGKYNAYSTLKGFKKSVEEKRFVNNIARFLPQPFLGVEISEEHALQFLKAVLSMKVHLIIEKEYYHSMEEDAFLELLIADAFHTIDNLTYSIIEGNYNLSEHELSLFSNVLPLRSLNFGLKYLCDNKIIDMECPEILEASDYVRLLTK